jgi:hypothetical protein
MLEPDRILPIIVQELGLILRHTLYMSWTLTHMWVAQSGMDNCCPSIIDGQQYRTATNVVSCQHSKLTQQALEFDAGFPMHYTETFEELLHSLQAWTTSRCPSKKSPGDHVDGGWGIVIHHTVQPAKTKGRRRRLHYDWHKETRTKDTNAGGVMDAITLCCYHCLFTL